MMKLLEVIDKANGYFFSESTISSPPSAATSDTSSAEHPAVYPSVVHAGCVSISQLSI